MMHAQADQQEQFDLQQPAMQTIIQHESGLQQFLDQLSAEQLDQVFGLTIEQSENCSCCIDEGIQLKPHQVPTNRIAGSGVLLGKDRAIEIWRQSGVAKITSHVSCGAAALYCQQHGLAGNADQVVSDMLQSWAQAAGLEFEYIDRLQRGSFHNARGVIVDGTARLRLHDISSMPKMFVQTLTDHPDEVIDTIKLAWAIASGDHGMPALFTPEQPFVVGLLNVDAKEDIRRRLQQDGWLDSQAGKVVIRQATINLDYANL